MKKIYTLGGDASSNYAQAALAQGNASMWGGVSSIGTALTNNSQTIGKFATGISNYFSSPSEPNVFNQTGSLY